MAKTPTTLLLSEEDRDVLARLCALTGLETAAAVIRLAIRESLAARDKEKPRKSKR